MSRAAIAAFILCLCALGDQAEAKRVALVIGNAAYRTVSPLANPLNDARLVAKALAASGFDVQLGTDLDRKGMEICAVCARWPSWTSGGACGRHG